MRSSVVGRKIKTRKELTKQEASSVIDALQADKTTLTQGPA